MSVFTVSVQIAENFERANSIRLEFSGIRTQSKIKGYLAAPPKATPQWLINP